MKTYQCPLKKGGKLSIKYVSHVQVITSFSCNTTFYAKFQEHKSPNNISLYKLNISLTNICVMCSLYNESIEHIPCKCKEMEQIWNGIQIQFRDKIGVNIQLTDLMKLMSYLRNNDNIWAANFVLIITHRYIFWCLIF